MDLSFLSQVPEYLVAALAVLGALKVVARLTPMKGDDKVLDAIEKPLRMVVELIKKLQKKDK